MPKRGRQSLVFIVKGGGSCPNLPPLNPPLQPGGNIISWSANLVLKTSTPSSLGSASRAQAQLCYETYDEDMFFYIPIKTYNISYKLHYNQGRRHGVDWGGHVHPTFLEDRFVNSSKLDEKMLGRGSFLVSQGSLLVSLRLQFSDQS